MLPNKKVLSHENTITSYFGKIANILNNNNNDVKIACKTYNSSNIPINYKTKKTINFYRF